MPGLGRSSHDPFTHLNPQLTHCVIGVSDTETYPQLLGFLMQQEDGENLVVYGPLYRLRNAHHQLVEIERGVDALADLEQQRQKLRKLQRPGSGFGSLSHLVWPSARVASSGTVGL